MFPPRWFIPYDVLFQLVTSLVALGISLFALRGYLWVRERTLYALFMAFTIISAGLFVNGITLSYALAAGASLSRNVPPVLELGYWAYYLMTLLGFGILVLAYLHRLREMPVFVAAAAAAATPILAAGPVFELVISILLFVILAAQLAHMQLKRSTTSTMVSAGFLLLLLSHMLVLISPLEDSVYVVGKLLQLSGFMVLMALLYRLRGSQ